jgi:hypothetical protein
MDEKFQSKSCLHRVEEGIRTQLNILIKKVICVVIKEETGEELNISVKKLFKFQLKGYSEGD